MTASQFLVFLQPAVAFPASQTMECRGFFSFRVSLLFETRSSVRPFIPSVVLKPTGNRPRAVTRQNPLVKRPCDGIFPVSPVMQSDAASGCLLTNEEVEIFLYAKNIPIKKTWLAPSIVALCLRCVHCHQPTKLQPLGRNLLFISPFINFFSFFFFYSTLQWKPDRLSLLPTCESITFQSGR